MQGSGPNLALYAREGDSFTRQSDQALYIAHFSLLHSEVCEQLAVLYKKHKEQQKQFKILQRNYSLLHNKHRLLSESAEEVAALIVDLAAALKLKPTRDAIADLRMICGNMSATFGLKIPVNLLPSSKTSTSDAALAYKSYRVQLTAEELEMLSIGLETPSSLLIGQYEAAACLPGFVQDTYAADSAKQVSLDCGFYTDIVDDNCGAQLLDLQRKLEISYLQIKDFNYRILPAKIEEIAKYELLLRTLQSSYALPAQESNDLLENAIKHSDYCVQRQDELIRELNQYHLYMQAKMEEATRKCAEYEMQLCREYEQYKDQATYLAAVEMRVQEAWRMLGGKNAEEQELMGQVGSLYKELEQQLASNREATQVFTLLKTKVVKATRAAIFERARFQMMKRLAQQRLTKQRILEEQLFRKKAYFKTVYIELARVFGAFYPESTAFNAIVGRISVLYRTLQTVEAKTQILVGKRAQMKDVSVSACDKTMIELLQRRKKQVTDTIVAHLYFLNDVQQLLGYLCLESYNPCPFAEIASSAALVGRELEGNTLARWQQCKDDILRTVKFLSLLSQKLNGKCLRVAAQRDVMPLSPSLTQSGHSNEKPTRLERQLSKELERKERENQRLSAHNSQRAEEQLTKLQSENERLRREVQRLKAGFYQTPEETDFPRRGAKSSAVSPRIETRSKWQQGRLQ